MGRPKKVGSQKRYWNEVQKLENELANVVSMIEVNEEEHQDLTEWQEEVEELLLKEKLKDQTPAIAEKE